MIMKQVPAALLLAVLTVAPALPAPARAADSTGTIEICRVTAAGDRHRGKAIEIPQGASFGDAGVVEDGKHTGIYWPLWIATTEKLTIGAEDMCVTGKARIVSNLDHHAVRAADHRWLVPSGTAVNPSDAWPADFDVAATVTGDFK
jgi:hypothetical protein